MTFLLTQLTKSVPALLTQFWKFGQFSLQSTGPKVCKLLLHIPYSSNLSQQYLYATAYVSVQIVTLGVLHFLVNGHVVCRGTNKPVTVSVVIANMTTHIVIPDLRFNLGACILRILL